MAPRSCSLESVLFDPLSKENILLTLTITLIQTSNSIMIVSTLTILHIFSPNEANDFWQHSMSDNSSVRVRIRG